MLEKQVIVGMLSILQDKQIQLREDTVVLEDGVEISRTYMRYYYEPSDLVATPHQIVHDVIAVIWTADVLARWVEIKRKRHENLVAGMPVPEALSIK